jgi:DNA polymerase (family 10)
MENARYAALLNEMADLLEVKGANPFKARAFARAARVIKGFPEPVDRYVAEGRATDIEGIGKSIAADLHQMRERKSCDLLDELRAAFPPGITHLLAIQGLGPKKVKKLYDELGVADVETLEALARDGRLAQLDGFGKKTEKNILAEIARLRRMRGRTPLARAYPRAQALVGRLRDVPQVKRAEVAGSLRRGLETVHDIDIVAAAIDPGPVMAAFAEHPDVEEVIAKGETKTSVYLEGGLQADLRVVDPEVFGAALHHFTGSKDHNIAMRSRALKRGLRISEWGVFRLREDKETGERVACATEEDIFETVDLPWIPPELREGRGEIEAAEKGELPDLVEMAAMRADLHLHTTASDGRNSIEEMAGEAASRGLEYIAVTDHSPHLSMVAGVDRDALLAQIDEIDRYNAEEPAVRVLKGLEVDILEDGELDMDAEVLERLDWVVGSVHSRMSQRPPEMTQRLVTAVRSGLISALGHPTGRKIGLRDGYDFDFDAVLEACETMNVALEVNASPVRLDLGEHHIRQVLARPKLWLTINSDAHSVREYDLLHFGVRTARRAWTPQGRVLNALPLDEFLSARRAPRRG